MKWLLLIKSQAVKEFVCTRCDREKKSRTAAYAVDDCRMIDERRPYCNGCYGELLAKGEAEVCDESECKESDVWFLKQ